jgi:hypothetical protein
MLKHFLSGGGLYGLRRKGRRHAVIILTAAAIGLLAGLTRNVVTVIAAGFLIFATFIAAMLVGGSASYVDLLFAILGFNAGLINLVIATALVYRVRPA